MSKEPTKARISKSSELSPKPTKYTDGGGERWTSGFERTASSMNCCTRAMSLP